MSKKKTSQGTRLHGARDKGGRPKAATGSQRNQDSVRELRASSKRFSEAMKRLAKR